MYFLYNLIDPITNEIKYVGYTKNPKRRIWEHIRDAKKGIKTYKCEWIRSLLDKQNIPIMEVISEYENHNEIVYEEMKLIQEFRKIGYKLTNLTEGGDGQKGGKLKKSHPFFTYNTGRRMSDESKLKLSESRKGIIFTEEHKIKLSNSKIGKKRSDSSKLKQSISRSNMIEVVCPNGETIIFNSVIDAVKFTGVNSNQIKKLINENRKSRKGFLFKKIKTKYVPQ